MARHADIAETYSALIRHAAVEFALSMDILNRTPSSVATLSHRDLAMDWLLQDSKLHDTPRIGPSDTDLVTALAISDLWELIRTLASKFKTLPATVPDAYVDSQMRILHGSLDELAKLLGIIAEELKALHTLTNALEMKDLPENSPVELVAFREKLDRVDGRNFVEHEENDVLLSLEGLRKVTSRVVHLERVKTYNLAVEKIAARKKNYSLALKFGRGLVQYIECDGLEVPYLCLKTLKANQVFLVEILKSKQEILRVPKVAKGCVDFDSTRLRFRELLLSELSEIFRLYGAEGIDTPVFELKEVLTGKYGEDSKLIYDLCNQGGEILSLRYDLTVPFARYCATHKIEKIKRYQIGKVYRRDEPQVARGRYREFYQCDVDFAGFNQDLMIPEVEVLALTSQIFHRFRPFVGMVRIKLSHRVFLDGMMRYCGVPENLLRAICSSIDKLDKESWDEVREEMTSLKKLDSEAADRIHEFINIGSDDIRTVISHARMLIKNSEMKNKTASGSEVSGQQKMESAFEELIVLADYLESIGMYEEIEFDIALARGLDYYTGLVYEVVPLSDGSVGSIAAGGRYDNLIGMFSGKDIPAVGISFGIERIFRLFEKSFPLTKFAFGDHPSRRTDVFICSIGRGQLKTKLRVARILRKANLKTDFLMNDNLKLVKQLPVAVEQSKTALVACH